MSGDLGSARDGERLGNSQSAALSELLGQATKVTNRWADTESRCGFRFQSFLRCNSRLLQQTVANPRIHQEQS